MPGVITFVSVGDVVVASLALLFVLYEGWLWRAARGVGSPRRDEHLWVAVICLCAAIFATGMAVQYNARGQVVVWALRMESVALVGLVHAMAVLVLHVTDQAPKHARTLLALHAAIWIALSLTPLVVAGVELREMVGLPHPYVRRANTLLGTVGSIAAFAIAGWAMTRLWRHRGKHPVDARWFAVAVLLYVLAGVHDFARALGPGALRPPLLEYGFLAFAGTLVARDVHRYRQMLERGQRDFRELIERNPDGVVVFRRGKLVWANAAAQTFLGATIAELEGEPYETFIDPDIGRRLLTELTDGAVGPVETTVRKPDGTEAEAELLVVTMEFDGGPAGVVVARDITARQELTARMMEMDRMITAGTLSAGIGHEINNPLAYALLNLREARREPSSEDQAELLDACEEGMERVQGVVRALRSFARPDDDDDRVIAVETVVRSALAITGNELRLRARVEVELEPSLGIEGGETRLGQVVTNLLINAAQAIPEGSPDDNLVRVRAYRDGDQAVIAISDTGEGIAEEHREQIFDPFFTTKPVTVGTGLGLSICQQKVRELGGELTIESTPGEGSTFRVFLPASDEIVDDEETPLEQSGPRPVRRLSVRVLLVDDEIAILSALTRALGRAADVVPASSAAEAIEILEGDDEVDLVISDLMMPGESGMALFETIQRRWPALAANMLFMSGGAFTEDSQRFCDRMGDRVMGKPLDVDAVMQHLRHCAAQRTSA